MIISWTFWNELSDSLALKEIKKFADEHIFCVHNCDSGANPTLVVINLIQDEL